MPLIIQHNLWADVSVQKPTTSSGLIMPSPLSNEATNYKSTITVAEPTASPTAHPSLARPTISTTQLSNRQQALSLLDPFWQADDSPQRSLSEPPTDENNNNESHCVLAISR